jgi:hypothetical protein
MGDTLNAIKAANEKFMSAFKAGDAGAIAALYTEDAKLLPPNSELMTGGGRAEAAYRYLEHERPAGIAGSMMRVGCGSFLGFCQFWQ